MTSTTAITTTTAVTTTWIELDVSKGTIEVCLLRESGKAHFKQFPNTSSGHPPKGHPSCCAGRNIWMKVAPATSAW